MVEAKEKNQKITKEIIKGLCSALCANISIETKLAIVIIINNINKNISTPLLNNNT